MLKETSMLQPHLPEIHMTAFPYQTLKLPATLYHLPAEDEDPPKNADISNDQTNYNICSPQNFFPFKKRLNGNLNPKCRL